MENICLKLKVPKNDTSTSITKREGEFIHNFIKEKNIKKTLEVGLAYGCSTAYVISATQSKHIAIDPNQDHYGNLGLRNIKKLDLSEHLIHVNDYAHNALPKLLDEGVKIDFAFIDGGHKFDEIFIDFYYTDMLLNLGGYVLLHDAWMRSTQHVISWIKKNKKNYKMIKTPIKNLTLFQKIGEDKRKWYDFKRFGTIKSYIPHKIFKLKRKR